MESTENDWNLSICGLNCAKCEIYLASHGDETLRLKLLNWFKKNIDSSIEDISCEKCRGPTNHCWSGDCKMRSCAIKRGLEYCFECPDFVCEYVEEFASEGMEHHKRTVENMKKAKEIGLKNWISLQKESQFCP
jgi:hypothetical protein